jgi:hypothetical protein
MKQDEARAKAILRAIRWVARRFIFLTTGKMMLARLFARASAKHNLLFLAPMPAIHATP